MRWCVLVVAASLGACTDATAFACKDDDECSTAAMQGTCEPSGYCSFPADDCDSGRRYGAHAPAALAGTCVPLDDTTGVIDPSVADDAGTMQVGESTGTDTTAPTPLDDSTSSTAAPMDATSALDDASTTVDGAESSTTATMIDVVVDAAIAVCTQDTVFDPAECAMEAGPESFTVDLSDGGMFVDTGWLRFDFDDTLADATIVSMELVVVVGSDASDESGSTGELWTTEPFDLAALSLGNPATVELVGEDLGAVALGAEIVWPLPVELFAGGDSLHFAIVPVVSDGLDLLDATSDTPPRLRISAM